MATTSPCPRSAPASPSESPDAPRAWAAFRAAHCGFEALEAEGGAMQPMAELFCMAEVTEARTRQLRALES